MAAAVMRRKCVVETPELENGIERYPSGTFAAVPAHRRNGASWRATATRAATSASQDQKRAQNSSCAWSQKEKLTSIV